MKKLFAHRITLLLGIVGVAFFTNCIPSQARIHGAKTGNSKALLHLEAGYHFWDQTQIADINNGRENTEGDFKLFYLNSALIWPLSESHHNTLSAEAYFKEGYIEPVFGESVGYTSKSGRVKELHLHISPLRQVVNFAL